MIYSSSEILDSVPEEINYLNWMGNLDTESGCAGYHSHVAVNFIIIIIF